MTQEQIDKYEELKRKIDSAEYEIANLKIDYGQIAGTKCAVFDDLFRIKEQYKDELLEIIQRHIDRYKKDIELYNKQIKGI
jgi:hypothetical protein